MRLSLSSSTLLAATLLLSVPQLGYALEAKLAGVVDWHRPQIGIPLLHRLETAPSFVALPTSDSNSSSSVITITESNVIASLDPATGNINWRHQLRAGEIAQSYHSDLSSASLALISSDASGAVVRLLDSITGHFIWETALGVARQTAETATDVVFDGRNAVYALLGGSTIAKLDSTTGATLWVWSTEGEVTLTRLVLSPSGQHITALGSEKSFTGYKLSTVRINCSDGSISGPASSHGSLSSPTTLLASATHAVWLDGTTLWTLDLDTPSATPERRVGSFVGVQDLGLQQQGYFLGIKTDGTAEVLRADAADGIVTAYTFGSADSAATSTSTYSGYVDATGACFVSCTSVSPSSQLANVHVYPLNKGDGLDMLSVHAFPFDTAHHGVILHTAVRVPSPGSNVIGLSVTTSAGTVQLYEPGHLQITREESLSDVKSVVFVDLPEREVLQQVSRDDETYIGRLLRHSVEARHLPSFAARFLGRLVWPSSTASVLTTSASSTEDGLWRDQFGFRKLVIVGTSTGKVFGLDSSNGAIVWSKLLGHSDLEGGSLDISGIFVTRPARTGLRPRVAVIGSSISNAAESTVAFELDSLSGGMISQAPALFLGRPSEIIPVTVDESAGTALAVLDADSQVHFFPRPPAAVESQNFVVARATVDGSRHSLKAFRVSTHGSPSEVWRLPFSAGEIVHSVLSTSQDPVASFGRVLGDRSSLYKYLNPHLIAVSTISAATSEGTVYLVDGVRGTIIYQVSHANLDTTLGIELSLLENWLVYRFRVEGVVATAGVPSGHRIVTVELFERGVAADKIGSSDLTSYSAEHDLNIISKTFILPSGIKALATTSTKYGITSKEILVADDQNQVHSIPRRLLDPRRPLGAPSALEREEMLIPYDPVISIDPKRILSHRYELLGISVISASPALLESTSLVFAHGLDLFSTRVMPSGTFDILSDSFNKAQLVLTIIGLSVGIVVVKPIVDRKKSRAKWF